MANDPIIKCTSCGEKSGTCQCWVECGCGWLYASGRSCRNPECVAAAFDKLVAEQEAENDHA